jgi:symplekin
MQSIHKSDAEQLVERARSTNSAQVRSDLLENIFDLILNKEPALLVDQFPSLLSFWSLSNDATKLWLLGCIETACVTHAELISLSLPSVMQGVENTNSEIQQKAVRVMTVLYPHILFLIANASFISPSHLASWNYLNAIKTKIFQFLDKKTNKVVLCQTIKLVEVIVLLQSDPDSTSQIPFIFTLKQIPAIHSILNSQNLSSEVPQIIALLGEKLQELQSGISTLVIINSLSRIAKERDKFVNSIFNLLIQHYGACSSNENLASKINAIKRSIKGGLLSVIKRKPACISWTDELSTTLSQLGAREIADRYKSHKASFMEGSDSDDELVESVTTVRKLLLKNKTKHEIVPTPLLKMQLAEFQKLPLSLVCSVVEAGIKTLEFPDQLEPLDLPGDNDENTLVNLLASAISPDHRQQRFKKKADREVVQPLNAATSFALTLQENATPFGASFGLTNNNDTLLLEKKQEEEEANRGQKRKAAILDSQQSQFQQRKRMTLSSSGNKEDITAKVVNRPTIILRSPQLNKRMLTKLSSEAISRVRDNENRSTNSGQTLLYTQIMSHLTKKLDLDDPVLQSIIEHIVDIYPKRNNIAIQWLYSEWISDEKRYEEILKRLIYAFRPKLRPKSGKEDEKDHLEAFHNFLLKIPTITNDVYTFLAEYCDDAEKSSIGIYALKDIVIHRPPCRVQGLKLLLKYTAHNNEVLRAPVIRLVITDLLPYTALFEQKIISFATMLIHTLIDKKAPKPRKQAAATQEMDVEEKVKVEREKKEETTQPTEPERSDDDIKRRLILYYSLCGKKTQLMQGLVEIFGQVSPNVKKQMIRQAQALIRTIGINAPYLLELLRTFPVDSKLLIISMLQAVSDSGLTIPPEMVSIVKDVYKTRVPDQRLLVPILGGLSKQELIEILPDLLELPPNGLTIALSKIINNTKPTTNTLSPADLLFELHLIDKNKSTLKKIMQAIEICFQQKVVVKQEVLSKVLSQLIEANPIPQLCLRTIIQSVSVCSTMKGFIMNLLKDLIVKEIWKDAQLWIGFMKCVKLTMPNSIPVVIALPPTQLDEALQKNPSMFQDVIEYTKRIRLAGSTGQQMDDGVVEVLRKHELINKNSNSNPIVVDGNNNNNNAEENITIDNNNEEYVINIENEEEGNNDDNQNLGMQMDG